MHGVVVEVEALELQGEQVGEGDELEALVCVALLITGVTLILIVPVKDLRGDKRPQRLLLTQTEKKHTGHTRIINKTVSPRK